METNTQEIILEGQGQRQADPSVRFASHPAGNPMDGLMELSHNMLTYGKKHGKIEIEPTGGNLCTYRFYNDGDDNNIPTFKRILEISESAGGNMSAQMGLSLCGVGLEVMGLCSRPFAKTVTIGDITVVKDGFEYGTILTFDGENLEIKFDLKYPKKCEGKENSFTVEFRGCKRLTDGEIDELKRKIVDTMSDNGFEIEFSTGKEKCILKYEDFLYEKELKGTDYFKQIDYYLRETKEPLTLKMADVRDLVNSGKGNKYEVNDDCLPSLSGGTFRIQNGMATICRDKEGWKFSGAYKDKHSTRNRIRFDIIGNKTIFHCLHEESQVKTKTNTSLGEVVDEYGDVLEIVSVETGEVFKIGQIAKDIKKFFGECKRLHPTKETTKSSNKKAKKKSVKSISEDTNNRNDAQKAQSFYFKLSEIKAAVKGLKDCVVMHSNTTNEEIIIPIINDEQAVEDNVRKTDFDIALESDNILEMCFSRGK
jgi:hypothetical protein